VYHNAGSIQSFFYFIINLTAQDNKIKQEQGFFLTHFLLFHYTVSRQCTYCIVLMPLRLLKRQTSKMKRIVQGKGKTPHKCLVCHLCGYKCRRKSVHYGTFWVATFVAAIDLAILKSLYQMMF